MFAFSLRRLKMLSGRPTVQVLSVVSQVSPKYPRPAIGTIFMLIYLVNALWLSSQCLGQTSPKAALAKLGSYDITSHDISFMLGRSDDSAPLGKVALAESVQLFALQRQALQTLRSRGIAATPSEVRARISNARVQERSSPEAPNRPDPMSTESSIQQFANKHSIAPEVYLDQVAFRMSWQRYLAKHLTEANLNKHFENQKPRFDGTEFRYQTLSIPLPVGQSETRTNAVLELTTAVADFESTKPSVSVPDEEAIDFKRLALEKGWSYQPAKWVRGTGDVDPRAIDALLALEPGDASEAFHTAAGAHVVQLLERKPGELTLETVQDEVRQHMLLYLLQHLASVSEKELPLRALTD